MHAIVVARSWWSCRVGFAGIRRVSSAARSVRARVGMRVCRVCGAVSGCVLLSMVVAAAATAAAAAASMSSPGLCAVAPSVDRSAAVLSRELPRAHELASRAPRGVRGRLVLPNASVSFVQASEIDALLTLTRVLFVWRASICLSRARARSHIRTRYIVVFYRPRSNNRIAKKETSGRSCASMRSIGLATCVLRVVAMRVRRRTHSLACRVARRLWAPRASRSSSRAPHARGSPRLVCLDGSVRAVCAVAPSVRCAEHTRQRESRARTMGVAVAIVASKLACVVVVAVVMVAVVVVVAPSMAGSSGHLSSMVRCAMYRMRASVWPCECAWRAWLSWWLSDVLRAASLCERVCVCVRALAK